MLVAFSGFEGSFAVPSCEFAAFPRGPDSRRTHPSLLGQNIDLIVFDMLADCCLPVVGMRAAD